MTTSVPEKEAVSSIEDLQSHLNVLAEMQETEHIASFLYVQGFKGIPYEANFCPVAAYLSSKTGKQVVVGITDVLYSGEAKSVDLPQLVQRFTIEFDSGSHKQLRLHPIHSLFIKMYESLAKKRTKIYA